MGWIDSVHCEKFRCDFVVRTFALVALVQPVLYRASCYNKTIQNASKHYEMHENMSLWSIGWIGSVHCEKFRCHFVERTFALVTPVRPVLYQASCINKTIQNASKHYETHQNMSLGSNGVDRFCSLRKIPMRLRGTNFCISCTSSAHFISSIVQ